jgi:replicative DNA helicase
MTDTKIDENSFATVEECILGSMINLPEKCKIVFRALKEDDFSTSRARSLFSEIRETEETRGSVDITLLAEHLKTMGNGYFESLGGFPYLGTGQK